ncbi:MAG: hypothetical protein HRT69_14860 [Flavobacteriaceae bacterium]|nr:hypothetical protein [Flavobacteriaceae bacterium]
MKSLLLYIICFSCFTLKAQDNDIVYLNDSKILRVGPKLEIYEDTTNTLSIDQVIQLKKFKNHHKTIPAFGLSKSTYWAKFEFVNNSDYEDFILEFNKVDVLKLDLYFKNKNSTSFTHQPMKLNRKKFSGRMFLFNLNIPKNNSLSIYIKFKSNWSVTFPVKISAKEQMLHKLFDEELINGLYIGIFLIMIFYNLFIYFSIKDKSYLLYVAYIFLFLLFQLNENGFFYKYFLYKSPYLYGVAVKTLPIITGIAAIYFIRDFVNAKKYIPKIDRFHIIIIILYIGCLFLAFDEKYNHFAFVYLNIISLTAALYALLVGIAVILKGFKPAWFFLIAWSILIVSIFQFTLSSLGILPYFPITDHSLKIGSVFEIVLLSLGLANRINVLKLEKEASQAQALQLINEKKSLIENQNTQLESMVAERTHKLEIRNQIISKKNEEKSIMMREIHHRVKNNLQMINSMVRIQSRYTNKGNTKDSLKEVERRIQTMALLHEKMYQSENLVEINVKEYIQSILTDLLSIYSIDKKITYEINISELQYGTETILFLGLLINELITNTLKHAFNDQNNGHITIFLKVYDKDSHQLIITNNGSKIDIDKFNNSKSLGQRLIKNFVKQLDGTLTIDNAVNTTFTILFKVIS